MHASIVRSVLLLLGLLAFAPSAAIAQPGHAERAILARVANVVITEQEFVERFELLPGIYRQSPGGLEAAKQDLLISLVAEKLLAANAQRYGVDQSEGMVRATDAVRRLLARDELYRDEIQRKVFVPSDEVARGIRQSKKMREIVYVYADRRSDLDTLRRRAATPATLVSQALTGSLLVDTITVRWGEAETDLEQTAFGLKVGAVSPVVSSTVGWFLLGVLREMPDDERTAQDPLALRTYVESRLRLRREEARLDEFVGRALQTVPGYGRKDAIVLMADILRQTMDTAASADGYALTSETYGVAASTLGASAEDTLAVMGSRWLSLKEGLERLYASGVRWSQLRSPSLERALNSKIREWVLQDLLETMALERGLDGRPQIVRHLSMWRDHYLSEEMVRRVAAQTRATDLDVFRTIALTERSIPLPRLSVRVATGGTVTDVAVFVDAMAGAPKDAAPVSGPGITIREFLNESVDKLGIVAVAAWPLKQGEWSKVTVVDSIAMSVQLLERFVPELPPGMYDSVATVATAQKVRRATAEVIARLARSERIEVYDDRMAGLEVSSTPMMTYRLLGFGGRMFAVPFVRPQTDWIDLLPPSGPPVP